MTGLPHRKCYQWEPGAGRKNPIFCWNRLPFRIDGREFKKNLESVGYQVGGGVFQLTGCLVGFIVAKAQFLHQKDLPQAMASQKVIRTLLPFGRQQDPFIRLINNKGLVL